MPFFRPATNVFKRPSFHFWCCGILFWAVSASFAFNFHKMDSNGFKVFFPTALENTAKECVGLIPKIKSELEKTFKWPFLKNPDIWLVNDREQIPYLAAHTLVAGFAVPDKNAVVIDCSRLRTPLDFKNILKHELCHLLIHQHIKSTLIPRWLDEGVAQWTSDGMMDIVSNQKHALLPKAVLSGKIIPLSRLEDAFPADPGPMTLAYEESKSFVDFIIREYGKNGLLKWLHMMKNGVPLRDAARKSFDTSFDDIVQKWYGSLNRSMTWMAQLGYYMYEILFAFGGVIVIFGFVRIWRKKRAYMQEME